MDILEIIKRQAWEEGFQEIIQESQHLKALAIAKELKNLGYPIDDIPKATGLSVAEIEGL